MPQSKTRKKKLADNPTEAQATGAHIVFTWRDIPFVIDPSQVKYGKAAFSLRVVNNESLDIMTRIDAAMGVLEAALGQEQLRLALEAEPDFFDDINVMAEFWDAYTQAAHGAKSGESRAS